MSDPLDALWDRFLDVAQYRKTDEAAIRAARADIEAALDAARETPPASGADLAGSLGVGSLTPGGNVIGERAWALVNALAEYDDYLGAVLEVVDEAAAGVRVPGEAGLRKVSDPEAFRGAWERGYAAGATDTRRGMVKDGWTRTTGSMAAATTTAPPRKTKETTSEADLGAPFDSPAAQETPPADPGARETTTRNEWGVRGTAAYDAKHAVRALAASPSTPQDPS